MSAYQVLEQRKRQQARDRSGTSIELALPSAINSTKEHACGSTDAGRTDG